MAELEAEVFLIGHWKNFEALEECLSLPELRAILEAYRREKHEDRRFAASLKGINLDGKTQEGEDKVEEIKRRIEARRTGKSETQLELDTLGLDVEIEE